MDFSMKNQVLEINFKEFESVDEMEQTDRELVSEAIKAQKSSYAPYSGFNVGSALRLANGMIVKGSNQENVATPSGICAERSAMFAAGSSYPDEAILSIAIAGGPNYTLESDPVSPCGACRQVMAEYQSKGGKPISVIMIGRSKIWKFEKVSDILPMIFDKLDKKS